jgi:hypothetical protein
LPPTAGGDTTDDNYSTFTDLQQPPPSAKKVVDKKQERRQLSRELHKMEKSAQLVKEHPNTLLPRSHFDKQVTERGSQKNSKPRPC